MYTYTFLLGLAAWTARGVPSRGWRAVAAPVMSLPSLRPPSDLQWRADTGILTATGEPSTSWWKFSSCGALCVPENGDPLVPAEHAIAYVAAGDPAAPPLLLIHGFGSSSFHWRSNVAALAEAGNRVYAIDLLGFGASDKPLIAYDSDVWVAQCAAFLTCVAGCGGAGGRRAVVCGNSIGGFVALALGAAEPTLVRGVASLNGAGKFSPTNSVEAIRSFRANAQKSRPQFATAWSDGFDVVGAAFRRLVTGGAFLMSRQPRRIAQVLKTIYPCCPERADDALVDSIEFAARAALH